jgi:hypothetical protein
VTAATNSDNSNGHNVDDSTPPPDPPEPPLVRFYCCFTSHDLDEVLKLRPSYSQLETVASFDAPIHDTDAIQTLARQYFASSRLEYWYLDRWKPINHLAYDLPLLSESIKALGQDIPCTLAIRDPDQFGTLDSTQDNDNDYNEFSNEAFGSSKQVSEMENTILFLVGCLKVRGYRRASDTHLYYPAPSNAFPADIVPAPPCHRTAESETTIATRDWILHQAQDDEELHMLLQDYPHALEHIAECLHYDFLWSSSVPLLDDDDPVTKTDVNPV